MVWTKWATDTLFNLTDLKLTLLLRSLPSSEHFPYRLLLFLCLILCFILYQVQFYCFVALNETSLTVFVNDKDFLYLYIIIINGKSFY